MPNPMMPLRTNQIMAPPPYPWPKLWAHMARNTVARESLAKYRQSTLFYKHFLQSVRRHGRVNEMEFMAFYFAALKNPVIPLRYAPLGMTLVRKGKVSLRMPLKARRPLESIFRKVEALEERL